MGAGQSGRALVVGGDSLVGAALQAHCRKLGHRRRRLVASSRRQPGTHASLDLSDPDFAPLARVRLPGRLRLRRRHQPAGLPGGARAHAADQRRQHARTDAPAGRPRCTHLVFLSSSQVFDGETPAPSEDDGDQPQERVWRAEARRRAGDRPRRPAGRHPAADQDSGRSSGRRLQGLVRGAVERQTGHRLRPTWRSRRSWWPT